MFSRDLRENIDWQVEGHLCENSLYAKLTSIAIQMWEALVLLLHSEKTLTAARNLLQFLTILPDFPSTILRDLKDDCNILWKYKKYIHMQAYIIIRFFPNNG